MASIASSPSPSLPHTPRDLSSSPHIVSHSPSNLEIQLHHSPLPSQPSYPYYSAPKLAEQRSYPFSTSELPTSNTATRHPAVVNLSPNPNSTDFNNLSVSGMATSAAARRSIPNSYDHHYPAQSFDNLPRDYHYSRATASNIASSDAALYQQLYHQQQQHSAPSFDSVDHYNSSHHHSMQPTTPYTHSPYPNGSTPPNAAQAYSHPLPVEALNQLLAAAVTPAPSNHHPHAYQQSHRHRRDHSTSEVDMVRAMESLVPAQQQQAYGQMYSSSSPYVSDPSYGTAAPHHQQHADHPYAPATSQQYQRVLQQQLEDENRPSKRHRSLPSQGPQEVYIPNAATLESSRRTGAKPSSQSRSSSIARSSTSSTHTSPRLMGDEDVPMYPAPHHRAHGHSSHHHHHSISPKPTHPLSKSNQNGSEVDEEALFQHPPTECPPRSYADGGPNATSPWKPKKPTGKIPGSAMDYLPVLEARFDRLEHAVDQYAQYRAHKALANSCLPGEVPKGLMDAMGSMSMSAEKKKKA